MWPVHTMTNEGPHSLSLHDIVQTHVQYENVEHANNFRALGHHVCPSAPDSSEAAHINIGSCAAIKRVNLSSLYTVLRELDTDGTWYLKLMSHAAGGACNLRPTGDLRPGASLQHDLPSSECRFHSAS